ncbi:T-complex protein 1 subunit theta-like [Hibiscus syriacus]|uniref:T-complex protein 1 subunit theta-like n=1 Tax=Hibiscus syriacus TaxID=106335 RepID=UPI0019231970|nr:T-complex protein 1 subunit theta-like [Hibiscus syriacus]
MNKMGINHLDKLFVTNDAATIVNELEVQHPAGKILVLAGKARQEEIGDGANLTVSFAGGLLQNAEELIRTGLHPSEIISGYTKAITKAAEVLKELMEKGSENMDVRDKEQVVTRMKAAVASKQYGQEDILSSLIADACIQVCPKNPANFDVDNVRVIKLVGGGLHNCLVIRGMVLKGDAVGSVKPFWSGNVQGHLYSTWGCSYRNRVGKKTEGVLVQGNRVIYFFNPSALACCKVPFFMQYFIFDLHGMVCMNDMKIFVASWHSSSEPLSSDMVLTMCHLKQLLHCFNLFISCIFHVHFDSSAGNLLRVLKFIVD